MRTRKVFRAAALCSSLLLVGVPARSVVPRDAGTQAASHKMIAVPRGQKTAVAARGTRILPESSEGFDEQRVIVRMEGAPLILGVPAGESPAHARKARLAALEHLADDIVRMDNDARARHGKSPRVAAEVVTWRYTHVFHGLAARVHRDTLDRLRTLPGVTGVFPDRRKAATLAESVPLIRADRVWTQLGYQGEGITVAIVDTGVDYTRPDLGGCFGEGCKVEFGYDLSNNDPDPMDDYGHGTHVAGIVAADGTLRGVAPRAALWAFKVLDQYGSGWDSTIIAGIEMATNPDGNPATADGAKVVNMSLGGPGDPDDALSQAADNAMAGGTVMVIAAGNSGPDFDTLGSPGCARQVLTVGASDKGDQMAWFSSRGPAIGTWQIKPEVIAPGVSITSTVPVGSCTLCDPSGYLVLDGTSMATPHVAGVAALLRERYPSWTPAQVKAALVQRSVDFSYGAFLQGAGRLDAWNAITPQARLDVPVFSAGLDDLAVPVWTRSQVFTLQNLGGTSRQYALSVMGSFPAGLSATVSPSSVNIPGGQSRTFTCTLTVDNALVPNVPAEPFAYEGTILAVSATETLHVPFALLKAPTLAMTFDPAPWFAILTDNATWWKYYNYPPASFSVLTPDATFDVLTVFPDAVSYVFHEGLHLTTNGQVHVARTEAIHPFTIVPVDRNGADLTLTTSMTQVHLGPKTRYFDSYSLGDFGGNLGSPTTFWLSPMSDRYDFEVSVLQEPGGNAPTYLYYGYAGNGVAGPRTFRNTPADFRHVTWTYTLDPGRSAVYPMTWLSSRPYDTWAVLGFGACDMSTATPAPFEREVYLTPLAGPQVGAGFLRQSVYGTAPPAPCSPIDFLFDTPFVAALSTTELDAWAPFDPVPVVKTANLRFPSGIGPFRWNGTMANTPDSLVAYGRSGPWFVSQLFDVRPATVAYDLLQGGTVLQSGILDPTLQLSIAPGKYALRVPFTQWYLGGVPGRAEAFATFDTQAADPNPPALLGLTIERDGTFLDRVPATGATVHFQGSEDSGSLASVQLHYRTAAGYAAVPVSGDLATGFTAVVPPPGGAAPTGPIALLLRDGSGNALEYSYCSALTVTPEVCDGFDDDCDGVLPVSEADTDGDGLSGCEGDCDDADPAVWGTPGEVTEVQFDAARVLHWAPPQTGGMPRGMAYAILRATDPRDFVAGTSCVTAFDGATPAAGATFFYQVRATNACPDGQGSLGSRSDGTLRVGRSCP